MTKPKVNLQELLLKKGESIVLGVAGVGLVVLLLWGVSTWAGAANSAEISADLTNKVAMINRQIGDPNAPDTPTPLPSWADRGRKLEHPVVSIAEFPPTGRLFDPVGRADTKRENPEVFGIEEYQFDVIRAPMPAYDLIDLDGQPRIAVKVVKKAGEVDKDKIKARIRGLDHQLQWLKKRPQPNPQPGNIAGGPVGRPGMEMEAGMPRGMVAGQMFDANARRTETALEYVRLEDLDKAIEDGKLPAKTVVPLRMAVINATFPLKKQVEEVRRAMRLKTAADAAPLVQFDGFEVRRRIILPSGTILGTDKKYADVARTRVERKSDFWTAGFMDYDYTDKYVSLIGIRKTGDYFEGADPANPDGAYLSYFYRYEDALVMPLPELVPELGSYPRIDKLKSITDTIAKMKQAGAQKVNPSELVERLRGRDAEGGKKGLFIPKRAHQTGSGDVLSKPAPASPKDRKGALPPENPVEVDNLLVRFLDCDIRPGFTYEYQIRVRMRNPNWGGPKEYMSNPKLVTEPKYEYLTGPWVQLVQPLTVPAEDFLYAADPGQYRSEMMRAHKHHKGLRKKLQAKDDQAVVQAIRWLAEVRLDGSNQREPVGAWVSAQMPVSRGDYVGKRTFVHLPLWSSEADQYVFRDLPAKLIRNKEQPKGWLVDFSTRNVLVDFEGGKVRTKASGGRTFDEDVSAELLIVREDGSFQVRGSAEDAADPNRKELTAIWDSWQKKVESRPAAGPGIIFLRPGDPVVSFDH